MSHTEWLQSLFASIDRKDTAGFVAHLSPHTHFRFGNAAPVEGRAAVAAAVDGFFAGIAGLRHTVRQQWVCGDTLVCHGDVCYRRHDGSELTVPFANIMTLTGAQAVDYRIFADLSALFAVAEA